MTTHDPARYHRTAIALHWLLAALLAYQFALGLRLDEIRDLGAQFTAFQIHKSIGILILLFSLARLALRLTKPRPSEADGGIKGLAARWTHGLFYLIMLGGPLTGWAVVSTAKIKVPTMLFGVVPWPHLPLGAWARDPSELGHMLLVWLLPALIALHLVGVAYHMHKRDGVPARMLGAKLGGWNGLTAGATLLAAATLAGLSGPLPDLWHKAIATPLVAPSEEATDADTEAAAPATSEASAEDAAPASADWTVQRGSHLGFSTSYAGTAIAGSFTHWTARIHFDPDDLAHARIAATVSLASAQSGDAERDENLKGESFFDTATHPSATFAASRFEHLGGGKYAASGTLSLRGVSRPVRLVFTLKIDGDQAEARGSGQINRLAFGVGQGDWAATDQIPDPVGINFTIRARREQ